MSTWTKIGAGMLAGAMLWGGATYAQAPPAPARANDCPKGAIEHLSGHVVKVDANQGTVSIRTTDGTTHEFQASRETLQDMKVGDKIEARLRVPENCKRG